MNLLKSIFTTSLGVLFLFSSAFGQKENATNQHVNLSSVCRGEFSDKIIESASKCTDNDLATAYSEINILERAIIEAQLKLDAAVSKPGLNGLSYNHTRTIEIAGSTASVLGALGLLHRFMAEMSQLRFTSQQYKRLNASGWASAITLVMGIATSVAGNNERVRIEVENSDIPAFREMLTNFQKELLIRKVMVESISALKNGGRK